MYNRIFAINEKPPTIYAILNSIVNFDKEEQTKISDLAKKGRTQIFDFDYPLTKNITKEDFECMILNKFLMRRIGFETVTAFKIQLMVKLNEIMPNYNMMFDAIKGWNLFENGEVTTRILEDTSSIDKTDNNSNTATTTSNAQGTNTADSRNSDTPENAIDDVKSGTYVSNYTYNENTANSSDTSTTTESQENTSNQNSKQDVKETITKNQGNQIEVYKSFIESKNNIYSMIFSDLENLFYGLI